VEERPQNVVAVAVVVLVHDLLIQEHRYAPLFCSEDRSAKIWCSVTRVV
jgi:hypothetical protein